MIWKGFIDPNVIGRRISHKTKSLDGFAESVSTIAECADSTKMKEGLSQISYAIKQKTKNQVRNKHFWNSDFMAHNGRNAYYSVKMVSKRTKGTEILNGENKLGYWLPFGSTIILNSGNELKDISPLWNWLRIPGVTNSQNWNGIFSKKITQDTEFVGGVSNGTSGTSAMVLDKVGLQAKKSWFFNENTMVAVGAGIQYNGNGKVTTTINQLNFDKSLKIFYPDGAVEIKNDTTFLLPRKTRIVHGGISYMTFNASMYVKIESKKSNWNTIGKSNEKAEGRILTMWIEHDLEEQKVYQYAVSTSNDFDSIEVLRANSTTHVVSTKDSSYSSAVFYNPTDIELLGERITVSNPCIMMLRDLGDSWEMTVSSPTHTSVEFNISGEFESTDVEVRVREGQSNFRLALEANELMGKSKQIILKRK